MVTLDAMRRMEMDQALAPDVEVRSSDSCNGRYLLYHPTRFTRNH